MPVYNGLIAHGHDDLLMSAALCAILDGQPWPGTGKSTVVCVSHLQCAQAHVIPERSGAEQRDDLLTDIDTSA